MNPELEWLYWGALIVVLMSSLLFCLIAIYRQRMLKIQAMLYMVNAIKQLDVIRKAGEDIEGDLREMNAELTGSKQPEKGK